MSDLKADKPIDQAATAGPAVTVPGRDLKESARIWIPAGMLVMILFACFIWPMVYQLPSPTHSDFAAANSSPFTAGHFLGTDQLGQDVWSRALYGGQVSLKVGLGSVLLGMLIGGSLGSVAALKGGVFEAVAMRILEIFISFPPLVLAIVAAAYLGPSELNVTLAISFFSIPSFARLARASVLQLREQPFMMAARLSGSSDWRTYVKHIVPNIFPQMMTFALISIGMAIIIEAALSFLGLGVPLPGPSWGSMIATGQEVLTISPYLVLIPAIFLFVTVFSLNLLGDALRFKWGVQ